MFFYSLILACGTGCGSCTSNTVCNSDGCLSSYYYDSGTTACIGLLLLKYIIALKFLTFSLKSLMNVQYVKRWYKLVI